MRADAQRNRDRIVEIARALFRVKGYEAVSMDEVAKTAEVGPGTLYRHFPTKESLYDAVLEAWAEKVNTAVDRALTLDAPARERLLNWLTDYASMLTEHKGAAARITAALGDPGSPFAAKCQTYLGANQRVIEALDSALRPGVDAMQISRLVGGVAAVVDNSELPADAAASMLAVVADGLIAS
ncbi:TetR family transcriptional regulator [Arthrobacter sp. SRS-W-1-2016]|uniref:TetR/AcrR family transcriptional regulator n=1 Tax=Arthrobacter sp. SRS-W-1-2016 TaxID=1930254 RepID=UPI000990C369|nr:TetR/AcrR family transcriptional regulator [Arthrobacter sp. SRS-W-1-2016]OOP63774.1 TetR family transcriptional regulator [Arthrobacter sp. SRS-W-1-2016]